MFTVGQKVWHRRGQPSGRVLEVDGDRIYLVQDNGVEVDFLARDLSAEAPEAVGAGAAARREAAEAAGFAVPTRRLTAREITPEHEKVLAIVPVRTLQAVAAVWERDSRGVKFSGLDVAGKLNVIAEVTDVPYRVIRTYLGKPGELGLLMGKGLADRARG